MVKQAAKKETKKAGPKVSSDSKKISKVDNKSIIIEGLTKLKKKYQLEKVKGKVMAYSKAIGTIQGIKEPITSIE